ncbi:hypothetical protein [Kitasatospora sp. NPDC093679]|uniref:hypothetical protein n=1 Tax=Kitasatospora sp. NPDC093679 TaxID=3154983 RepID=UPI00342151BD
MPVFTAVVFDGIDWDGDAALHRFVIEAPDEEAARLVVYALQDCEEVKSSVVEEEWQIYALVPAEPCGPETYDRLRVTGPGTWEWADQPAP